MSVPCLAAATTNDLPTPREIVALTSEDKPIDAFRTLIDSNILSAPVLDKATGNYIGFLDVRDLVAFVVFEHEQLLREKKERDHDIAFLERMIAVGAKMHNKPITGITVSYLARCHIFRSVQEGASLDEVGKLLAMKGCHRVAVLNGTGVVVNIISQSTIIKFLDDGTLGDAGLATIDASGVGSSPVISVHNSAAVIDAYRLMSSKGIMGLAVVDENGKYIGNMSSSDLKLYVNNPTTSLDQPVMNFLNIIRQQELMEKYPAIQCKVSDTVEHIVAKLAATRIHRLFAVKGEYLHSVISLTDILAYLYSS